MQREKTRNRCKRCGKLVPRGALSQQGYCHRCGVELLEEAIRSLKQKKGRTYTKWLEGLTRYVKSKTKRGD